MIFLVREGNLKKIFTKEKRVLSSKNGRLIFLQDKGVVSLGIPLRPTNPGSTGVFRLLWLHLISVM